MACSAPPGAGHAALFATAAIKTEMSHDHVKLPIDESEQRLFG